MNIQARYATIIYLIKKNVSRKSQLFLLFFYKQNNIAQLDGPLGDSSDDDEEEEEEDNEDEEEDLDDKEEEENDEAATREEVFEILFIYLPININLYYKI